MKIKTFYNYTITKVFLAFAIASLSISSVKADDYYGGTHENIIDPSGGYIYNSGDLNFFNCTLGTPASGRFTIESEFSTYNVFRDNTTLYADSIALRGTYNFGNNSKAFVANGIYGEVEYIWDKSTYTSITLEYDSYLEASINGTLDYISIAEYSTWRSVGSSSIIIMENFSVDNSTIDLLMTSAYDTIYVDDTYSYGYSNNTKFQYSFTDDFIESILAGSGYFDLNVATTIVFSQLTPSEYVVTDYNDSYTWTVTDLGGNIYRIGDIQIIPEPSTYAMIFGILALGLAIYRRRK